MADVPMTLRRLAPRARASVLCPVGEVAGQVAMRLESVAVDFDRFRLGPGEWLFEAEASSEVVLEDELTRGLVGLLADVQNVSDAWDGWRLEGPGPEVFRLLAQGANLSPLLGASGRRGVRLLLGPLTVLVAVVRDVAAATIVDIQVERAYADSLGVWLRLRLGRTAGSSGGGIGARALGG